MLKFAVLVLLCLVYVASQELELFSDCVDEVDQRQKPGQCVLVPPSWLVSNTYRNFAHRVLGNATFQPAADNRNTPFGVTRAATHASDGIVVRIEFTTVQSSCNSSLIYSKEQCLPVGSEVNALCQAKFRYDGNLTMEYARCDPQNENI
ncbi:uncharacterized protein LOC119374340 [Rhipicephalus sanguineus]|uniref:uncharacterized protein LOC119374340 n=1 Tax=Rhipicephalus sanguineus TaxID=34632 RepID=UPI0018941C2A|nr:uncharacterized protein LOC119374340 [Rhipicephalus sanguineus]